MPETSRRPATPPPPFIPWLILGALTAQIVANSASATCPRSLAHQRLKELLHWSDGTVGFLYLGNNRVARPIGFAFDGFEEIAFDRGRLAGNAFVASRKGAGKMQHVRTEGRERIVPPDQHPSGDVEGRR